MAELWSTREEHPPISGWVTGTFDPDRRDSLHRASRFFLVLLLVVGAGLVAWSLTGRRASQRAEAVQAAAIAAQSVQAAAQDLGAAIADLEDGALDDPLAVSATLARLDETSRDLFDAGSGIHPQTDADARMRALEAAQQGLDIETAIGDAVAYAASLELISQMPALPTRVDGGEVAEVAADVAAWVTRYAEGASSLPQHPLLEAHRAEVVALGADLEQWQTEYLGALRDSDPEAARLSRAELAARMQGLERQWVEAAGAVGSWAAGALAVLSERLAPLTPAD